jgi:hypothetical protein
MKKFAYTVMTVFLIPVFFTGFSLLNSAHGEPKIMFVDTAAGLKMRKDPDQKAEVLVVIPNGKSVQIIEEKSEEMTIGSRTGKWCKVEFEGKTGWVFGGFLKQSDGGSIALLDNLPVSGRLKSLNNDSGKFVIAEYCDFDGYSEIDIICGEFEGSPQCRDNNGKTEYYCTVQRYSGRNKKELQFGGQKEIFKVVKKDNVYQLYSKSGLEYELTWPVKEKGVMYINKEPYAVPGEDFPVRKGKCGKY